MAEPLRHRQTKEAATDMFSLQPPRHISTLHIATILTMIRYVWSWGQSGHSVAIATGPSLTDAVEKVGLSSSLVVCPRAGSLFVIFWRPTVRPSQPYTKFH
jgi:hypothetical protein